MADGGVATCARAFAAPMALCFVGVKAARLLIWVPFREAAVTWTAPRLMAWPFTKLLREATVTAFGLCALTKLKLWRFVVFTKLTLLILVLTMLMLLMKVRLQRKPGKNGSPNPSGNQPIPPPKPNPNPKFPPPKKPTNAGPKIGRSKIGPGHQPHPPPK
jgi:hypothetical protein